MDAVTHGSKQRSCTRNAPGLYFNLSRTSSRRPVANPLRLDEDADPLLAGGANQQIDLGAVTGDRNFSNVGATYADATHIYAQENTTGRIYRVDVATRASILVSTGPASNGNDGARCATARIPTITVAKAGYYAKVTTITIRRGKSPSRVDRCQAPGSSRLIRCPRR